MTYKELELVMAKRWRVIQKRHPTYCLGWLIDMHRTLDWYDKKRRQIRLERKNNKN